MGSTSRRGLTGATEQAMAKAAAKGILLWEYIKHHAPEVFVRNQLDRGELRHEWKDINNNARASDDGGELPPKGWWLSKYTKIDYERHSVEGLRYPPFFPPMYFVRVFPAVTPADTSPEPKTKSDVVLDILIDADESDEGLPSGLTPVQIWGKVLPEFRRRWKKLRPDEQPKLGHDPVERTQVNRVYQNYLKSR
jgi:hypothetical protein